ncbi:C-factor-like [Cuculus canorus]|uniref:C-factor-like n=1 Tax=Cuculus canorus TaxID=55661 RepID=UPI0023AA57F2|nr:C-factor-like [Cuculus canorus]
MAALAWSVLVTGSNRGIRLELVRQLATCPQPLQHIFATCHEPRGPRGKALRELAAQHPSIKLVQLDSDNSPNLSLHATLRSLDSQQMLSVFATNVVGLLQVGKKFLPFLEKAAKDAGKDGLSCSRAVVINISTKLGFIGLCLSVPQAPMYPYHASKAAQNMVMRCMAVELQDKEILCTALHPGWVKTDTGTDKAPLTVDHSVRGVPAVLASLSQDTSGAFLDWEGNSLPW